MNNALLCGLACMLLSPDIFSRCNNVNLDGPRSEYAFLNSLYPIGADTANTGAIVSNNDSLSGATWLLKHYATTNPHLVKTKGFYDIYTFENGLANTSGTVRLGGSLNQATTITGASNSLSFGTSSSALYGLTVVTENLAVIQPSGTSTEWMPLVARGANGLETRMGGSYIEARRTSDGAPSNLNFNSNVYFGGNVEFSGAVTSTWNSNLKLTTNSGGYNVWSERNFGIGISTPSAPLHVIGRPRFVTGNEGQGKVWTSDAGGNGEWLTAAGGNGSWTVSGNNISNANADLVIIGGTSTSTEMPLVARGANGLETRMGGSYIEARHTSDGAPSNLNFNSNVYFAGNVEFSGAVASTWNSNLKLTTNSGGYNVWSERNFGIGISTPSAPLHVIGRPRFVTGNEAQGKVWTSDANGNGEWLTATGGSSSWTVSGNNISNANAGLVIIGGTVNPQPLDANIRLAVNGNICAQKLTVTINGWADYVFAPTYKLRDLKKLKIFLQKNQHLPEMPSAAEVQNNGISLGDNQVALLKKVEELTLYLIKEHEEIEKLKKANSLLQLESNQIKKMLKAHR